MNKQIKVGDTFRVFEVVKREGYMGQRISNVTGIEIPNKNKLYPYRLLTKNGESLHFECEVKQVGTIRIKWLKEKL